MIESHSRLRFSMFQPIDIPWDNSIASEPNASDEELICGARRQRREPVRPGRRQASSGRRRNPAPRSNFWFGRCAKPRPLL